MRLAPDVIGTVLRNQGEEGYYDPRVMLRYLSTKDFQEQLSARGVASPRFCFCCGRSLIDAGVPQDAQCFRFRFG